MNTITTASLDHHDARYSTRCACCAEYRLIFSEIMAEECSESDMTRADLRARWRTERARFLAAVMRDNEHDAALAAYYLRGYEERARYLKD